MSKLLLFGIIGRIKYYINFLLTTAMEIIYAKSTIYKTIRIISQFQRYSKCEKYLYFIIFVIVCWCVNIGNSWPHVQQHSYGGHFVGEDEAEAIVAIESSIRLAKIPCNFTTTKNCIYAEKLKLYSPFKETNEIVVSWVPPHTGVLNKSDYHRDDGYVRSININTSDNNVAKKAQNDLYNFNWIFELLACMMLASVFEICLLILRNIRNISLALFGFWSTINVRLQMLCFARAASTSAINNKNDNMRKRNAAMGEKRTLSYIFAILTWRASQTAKGSAANTEANLRDDNTNSSISYGHVTTMGDLLLLILFTHVYYQRQKFQQGTEENKINTDPKDLLESQKGAEDQSNAVYHKLYDKQSSNNNIFNESSHCKRNVNKRCSHFCGNMYQQISSLQEHKSAQVKLTPLTNYTTKIPYLTYCTGIVWYTCCFCQYSYRSCCYCFSTCRRWNQRCYVYIPPICNTINCCCFYKSLKFVHDVNYQYFCYLCCWPDFCHINYSGPHMTHRCGCRFYCERLYNRCCLCNPFTTNKLVVPSKVLLSHLLNTIEGLTMNIYWPSSTSDLYMWKLSYNNQKYSLIYDINGQKYSLIYLTDGRPMCVNSRNHYKVAVDVFSSIMPQYLVTLKNCQTLLKWKKVHIAVLVMALIVICASCSGANYDFHHRYYCSLFNKYHKHFCKCKQNKRRRRRRRQRHQHCKAYRPQHYFYATLMSCVVRRQNRKRLHKKLINKLCKKSTKLMATNTTTIYEYSLAPSTLRTPMRTPMVRNVRRVRGSKPNIVWLIIGLIWFEGPKIVNCNVIINYQNQQQHEQQQQQQQQQHQQVGNNHKEAATTTTNSVNSSFEYKIEYFNQMKTKNNNSNSNNNSNNSTNNKSKNKNSSSNNNSNTSNNRSSSATSSSNNYNNIQLSVNLIPIFNTIHFKQYCNSNYHQKFIRSSKRFQRALKANPNNLDTSITPSASLKHNSINDDFASEQLSSSEFQNINEENHAQSDLMRLESIKHQILFKLGLTRKPNVSHPLPKQFIWDTIYRADGIRSFHDFSNTNNFHGHEQFVSHRNSPYWSATSNIKGTNSEPIHYQNQRPHHHKNKESLDNIKRSLESVNNGRKKYGKSKQHQRQTLTKYYSNNNNNDENYQKGATKTSINLNRLLYTSNRNNLNNHTNKTVNFTILKQSKHQQQIHKNSQHSTTTGKKTTTIHQQQNRRQHEQINKYINKLTNSINFQNNNKITTNTKNNINNNGNNINNNVNNSNNIIVVQKHLQDTNNNKYNEEAKKFTYLTDINSSSDNDDTINNMEESNNHLGFDDNNSIVRKQQKEQYNIHLNEKVSENDKQFINIDTDDGGSVDLDINTEPNIFHHDEDGINDDGDDYNYNNYNHNHRNGNHFPKFENFDDSDDFFGSTQEIITFAEKGKIYKNHRLVEFSHQNNENPKQKLHVRNAEIHIRIDKISIRNKSRAGSGIKRKRLKIWIFQLIENNYTYKGFDHVAQFCASFEVDTSRLGWKKFDITSTVKDWYSRREGEKLRLLIDCTGCGKMYAVHLFNSNNDRADMGVRERRFTDETRYTTLTNIESKHLYNVINSYEKPNFNFPYNQTIVVKNKSDSARKNSNNNDGEYLLNSNRPFLVLHTEARKQRRVRRRAINCNGALHGQCCKESFYVSFKALGWDDWIIAPRGYFANYCRGDCTGPYRTPDTFQTFHAHFIEEYRKMGLLNGMQPCCAPIKFSSMSLIYYGDEGIIKRDLPKMVVDECGCP